MQNIQRTLQTLVAICLFSSALHAQVVPQKILFNGAPQYAAADLLAVSGLKPHTPLNADGMNAAARHLADTGLFTNVTFSFDNVSLIYRLEPAPAKYFLPARYDNFVWWTTDEITAELHRRHPLFTTLVPQSGTMQDALVADLTAMLAAKGITATVNATPGSSVPNNPTIDCVHFSIVSPPVRVRTIEFADLSPELAAKLEGVRNANQGQDYLETDTPAALKIAVTDAIQDEGYLDVALDNFHRSAPVVEPTQVSVNLSISVRPGDRYHIAKVDWPGSPLLSTADFQKLSSLKVGDAPSITALRQTRLALAHAYTLHGYMAAKTNIEPQTDPATHLVSYLVTVTPGVQYAFRNLTLTGVDDQQRQDFLRAWKMQSGMTYNGAYVLTFLHDNSAALRSLNGYSLQWKQLVNDNTHTVDLQLELKKGGPLQ